MTRYDPYSYGQVNLSGGKTPPAGSPEDILFADPGPTPKKVEKPEKADSSWELLDADVSTLLPNASLPEPAVDFGTEVLGEKAPPEPPSRARGPGLPVPAAAQAVQSAPEMPRRAAQASAPAGPVRQRAPGRPAEPMAGDLGEGVALAPKGKPFVRPAPRRVASLSGTMVPAALFAGGGTGAAWLALMEQNLVMAGIVGAISLVAAAFTWVWLRG
jgi:hypothetical protein